MPVPIPTPTPTPTPPPTNGFDIDQEEDEPLFGEDDVESPWASDPTSPGLVTDPGAQIDPFDPIGEAFDPELQDFANQLQP